MKIWKTTWEKFDERFSGLRRLSMDRKDYKFTYGPSILPYEYRVAFVYNPKKDCTYVGSVCRGFIAIGRPSGDDYCIAVRYDGKVTADDFHENFAIERQAVFEELEKWYKKTYYSKNKKES